jgi:hypothetical protein
MEVLSTGPGLLPFDAVASRLIPFSKVTEGAE